MFAEWRLFFFPSLSFVSSNSSESLSFYGQASFQIFPFLTSVIREVPLSPVQFLPNTGLYGLDTPVSPADSPHFSKLPQDPLLLTCLYYLYMDVNPYKKLWTSTCWSLVIPVTADLKKR